MNIHIAKLDDAQGILDIYAPIVEQTIISFELAPPTVEEIQARIAKTRLQYPYLVCKEDGVVAGYVYGSTFRSRPAYQWTVEVTVYVHPDFRRRNIARALYSALFDLLKVQGYVTAVAVIGLPNEGSVTLHEGLGFESVGVFERVGYKLGGWHPTGWWQYAINPPDLMPNSPIAFPDLDAEQVAQIIDKNERLFRSTKS